MYKRVQWLIMAILFATITACNDSSSNSSSSTTHANAADTTEKSRPDIDASAPLIAGTASWVNGTYVWTDYVYDDHGANVDGVPGGDGVDGYPPALLNTADLVQLKIGLDRDSLAISATLQTLVDPAVPVLGIAFDTDASPLTGATTVPGTTWEPSEPLGIDLMITIRHSGTTLQRYTDGEWAEVAKLEGLIDPQKNTMAAEIPLSLANPHAKTWRAFAVLGFSNPETGESWQEGKAIMDLAFVGDERPILLQTVKQADVLAGEIDPAVAAATIDFSKAEQRVTELASPRAGRFETFLHLSKLTLPEGVRAATGTIQGLEYLGPYQPYLVWVPDPLPSPAPLLVFLHGASQNHLGDTWVNIDEWPYHGMTPDMLGGYAGNNKPVGTDPDDVYLPNDGAVGSIVHFERTFAPYDAPGVVIFPLGRMNSSGYSSIFEEDVLEALEDAMSRFDIDSDRVSLSGSSMGGIGSFRLGALYPDLWSHIFPIVGDGSDVLELLDNLYNVPVRMHNGLLDPLVPQPGPSDTADAIDSLGYDYRYWLVETREHESLFIINHCVRDEAFSAIRDTDPARVVYVSRPEYVQVDNDKNLSHTYDGAYWVADMEVRENDAAGRIDVISLAHSDRDRVATPFDTQYENFSAGRDECGLNPEVQTLDSWTEQGITLEHGEPQRLENRFIATLTGLSRASLDITRMNLKPDTLTAEITSDESAELVLYGSWGATVDIFRDGELVSTVPPEGDAILIPLTAGTHEYALQ